MARTLEHFRMLPDMELLLMGKEASVYPDAFVIALIERFEDKLEAVEELTHERKSHYRDVDDRVEELEIEVETLKNLIATVRRVVD